MEKDISNQTIAKSSSSKPSSKTGKAEGMDRPTQLMWISRICGFLCFSMVFFATVLGLSLIHLTSEAETNAVLVARPIYSENLAYFEPLKPEMKAMSVLDEMYVRQYIVARNTVWKDIRQMQIMWGPGGVVDRMSTPNVYNAFFTKEAPVYFDMEYIPEKTVEVHITRIKKDGWNSFQVFFDKRIMVENISEPVIEHFLATIQFRYYPFNAIMANRLRNPMGFTITFYGLSRQKK